MSPYTPHLNYYASTPPSTSLAAPAATPCYTTSPTSTSMLHYKYDASTPPSTSTAAHDSSYYKKVFTQTLYCSLPVFACVHDSPVFSPTNIVHNVTSPFTSFHLATFPRFPPH
ncbi:hypothetical protein Pcinc_005730 [Petrolisthes cinctipes]|uniref:Uncharacterized protein n=1 Tax=Petrolisthes cinctipes TaxID=88211 RepID=A0AAE1GCZ0_PETCI|nr:hypothetical protein Pcinc_005730 [Petrolisthes cinctipes]